MSDDTPTQPFDPAGDETPTQRFDAPAETVPLEVAEERKSRRLIIILASIGGALLLAVLIVLILLLTRGDATPGALPTSTASPTKSAGPSPSATPSASPTPTPTTPAPPPPSTDASVDDFTVSSTTVDCTAGDPEITLIWSTSNATKVLFGIDSPGNDATNGAFFSDIPESGNSDTDFPPGYSPFHYTCGNGSHTYVITAVNDTNGTKDSVAITVTG
jgi:hypothetical protein